MKPEIITALDFDNFEQVERIVDALGDSADWYKVGLELFVADGQRVLSYLREKGKKIFLDLKFHDIPNTVKKAVHASLKYEVQMINMHAQGGVEMMKASVDGINEICSEKGYKKPLLIAVTLLTSLDESYFKQYGINYDDTGKYVVSLAEHAKAAGMDGTVSSAKETPMIKEALGTDFITVTPGIRPAFASKDDQKRIVTPADAVKMGTDYIVVGRPITQADDPAWAANKIREEMK